jgi:hypothetical protein
MTRARIAVPVPVFGVGAGPRRGENPRRIEFSCWRRAPPDRRPVSPMPGARQRRRARGASRSHRGRAGTARRLPSAPCGQRSGTGRALANLCYWAVICPVGGNWLRRTYPERGADHWGPDGKNRAQHCQRVPQERRGGSRDQSGRGRRLQALGRAMALALVCRIDSLSVMHLPKLATALVKMGAEARARVRRSLSIRLFKPLVGEPGPMENGLRCLYGVAP